MTLQERMIATYLRQANLPPEEKMKLKLFLGLLLVTFDSDPSDEDGQDRTRQDKTGQDRTGRRPRLSRRPRPRPLARPPLPCPLGM